MGVRKTGQQRKEKRKARRALEQEVVAKADNGDHWTPANEREARANNNLIRRAMRWNTDVSRDEMQGRNPAELKAREIAILVTHRNMLSPDPGVANSAVRNLIAMEAQNQADDRKPEPQQHLHLHAEIEKYDQVPTDAVVKAMLMLEDLRDGGNSSDSEPGGGAVAADVSKKGRR